MFSFRKKLANQNTYIWVCFIRVPSCSTTKPYENQGTTVQSYFCLFFKGWAQLPQCGPELCEKAVWHIPAWPQTTRKVSFLFLTSRYSRLHKFPVTLDLSIQFPDTGLACFLIRTMLQILSGAKYGFHIVKMWNWFNNCSNIPLGFLAIPDPSHHLLKSLPEGVGHALHAKDFRFNPCHPIVGAFSQYPAELLGRWTNGLSWCVGKILRFNTLEPLTELCHFLNLAGAATPK